MKKHILGLSAAAGAAALMALFGTATAAANDYVGQTYADASVNVAANLGAALS